MKLTPYKSIFKEAKLKTKYKGYMLPRLTYDQVNEIKKIFKELKINYEIIDLPKSFFYTIVTDVEDHKFWRKVAKILGQKIGLKIKSMF